MRGLRDIVIPGGGGGGAGSVNFSAGTTSNNLTNIVFSNGSGVTFGLNGSTITASVAAVGGAQTGISGIIVSDATYTSGTVSFSNQANITIGSSVNGATQFIRLSGNPAQTNQSAIKGFGVSNTGQTAGNTGISSGIDWVMAGSNSITLSQSTVGGGPNTVWIQHPAWITTAMQSNAATISNINVSAGTTSNNLSAFVLSNSNNVSFGLNGSTITGSASFAQTNQSAIKGLGVSNTGQTAGNTGISTGIDWVLAGSQSITLSQSTVGGGPDTIWFQHPAWLTTAMQSGAATISNVNISAGTTSNNLSNWVYSNSNGVSFGLNGSTITASVAAAGGAQTAISGIVVSDTTYTSGTVSFSNQNGVTIGSSVNGATQYIRLSVATNYQSQGAYLTTAALSGDTSKYVQNWKLTGNTAGTTSSAQGTDLWFSGGNNITISGNSNTIIISAFNQSNQTLGLYALGNTTQNSSTTLDARTLSFNAIGAATWGYSNGSIQVSVPPVTQLTGINGISLSSAGSTISIMPQWVSSYENMPEGFNATMTFNAASISHAVAFQLPQPISASFLRIPVLMTTNSTTIATLASATASANGEIYSTWNAVVYSMGVGGNSKSLQSVTSSSAGFTFRNSISITNSTQYSITQGFSAQALGGGTTRTTQYSISNTNYSFTTNQIATEWSSNRMIDINWANSLSPGNYWLVIGYSSSTATSGAAGLAALTNCNVRYSNHYGISMSDISFAIMGSTNQTSGGLMGAGSFSTAGGGTTNSIPISAISSNASNLQLYFQLLRSA